MACKQMVPVVNNVNQESILKTEEIDELVRETKEEHPMEKNTVDQILILNHFTSALDKVMSLEELIDLGFRAKHTDNFEQAAFYFSRALTLEPKPDIAFYLILDCYWLWSNLGEQKYALTQIDKYVKSYLPQFNYELRQEFEAWMTREDIHKNY